MARDRKKKQAPIRVGPYEFADPAYDAEHDVLEVGLGVVAEVSDRDGGVVWMTALEDEKAIEGLILFDPLGRLKENGDIRIPFPDGAIRRVPDVERLVSANDARHAA